MSKNLKHMPLVSVIIPSFNHENFIKDAIESVIRQVYDNVELIIIDDGSSDGSTKKIQELAIECKKRFKNFVYLSRSNKGLSKTLNEGMEIANGSIIAFCSSDDYLHENKIFAQVEYFNTNLDSDFCFTSTYVVNDCNAILKDPTNLANKNLSDNISFDDIFTFKVHLPVTGAYRAKFLKHVLRGFDESLAAEDYDINLRIFSKTRIGYLKEKLYYYRSPAAIGSERKKPVMRRDVSESHRLTIEKYKNHYLYKQAILEWNFRRFLYFSSYRKQKKYALEGMWLSLQKAGTLSFLKAAIKTIVYWK